MKRFYLWQVCAALPVFAILFTVFRPIIDAGSGTVAGLIAAFYVAAVIVLFVAKQVTEFLMARIVAWGNAAGVPLPITVLGVIVVCVVSVFGFCVGGWLVLLHFLAKVL